MMRHVRCAFIIFLTVMLVSCSDVVTTQFATADDAKAQGAFEHGWLPPVLPASAKHIVEKNNLDLNTGTGGFDYDLTERAAYIERMVRGGASLQKRQDVDVLTLTTNGTRWEIELPTTTSRARYNMKLLR